jgi:hypothetical protein
MRLLLVKTTLLGDVVHSLPVVRSAPHVNLGGPGPAPMVQEVIAAADIRSFARNKA